MKIIFNIDTNLLANLLICGHAYYITFAVFRLNESELFLSNPESELAGWLRVRILQTADDTLAFCISYCKAITYFTGFGI